MLSRRAAPLLGRSVLRGHVACLATKSEPAPPMVYIKGEEMTRYTMDLIIKKWIDPHFDTGGWEYFDLSCKNRDDTEDKCLFDAVAAGARIGAIFKEPTVTPTAIQKELLGLKKTWGSPNGAMRRGWNGITISRDTIHIEGMELGYKKPVLFERHAVGGEYGAGFKAGIGKGKVVTVHLGADGDATIVDQRDLSDDNNAVVTYHNPIDNVTDLAHHFFARCLVADGGKGVVPYVVTKKTVFKWQEGFWVAMKEVFDAHYKDKYLAKGLLETVGGELPHLISDAATMQIIRWTGGGFGMAAHNYDGDMLTDEVAQVHRSPGFINSVLIGKKANGEIIKEYEASHGTVADMDAARLRGEETSLNPLGMVEALFGAMDHSADLAGGREDVKDFTASLRKIVHKCMVEGKGTRDLCGPSGLTTEQFIDEVASQIGKDVSAATAAPTKPVAAEKDVDDEAINALFNELDTDGNGVIDKAELKAGLIKLNLAPIPMIKTLKADT
mmetsp:Transcript_13967/g.46563  ORF Transcript_13967/g.46563 Transcript_13967/m.46563 type:complete len:498 (-) Transcript_13967:235-1728(-)